MFSDMMRYKFFKSPKGPINGNPCRSGQDPQFSCTSQFRSGAVSGNGAGRHEQLRQDIVSQGSASGVGGGPAHCQVKDEG